MTRKWRCPITAMLAVSAFVGTGFGQNLHLGDVDDDGVVTVRDIALVVEHVTETTPLDVHHSVLADVTKDGAVNQADVDELIKEVLETRTPENLPLSTIRFSSPAAGEGDVSVNRETILHFTVPLAIDAALDTTRFYAEFAGRKVLSRVEIASDRKKASLFYLEPLPSNARLRVTFDGTQLSDLIGRPFDANGDGLAGGVYRMSFDTHTNGGIPATGITGRVLQAAPEASATVPESFPATPVPGVTITVDGQEQTLRTTTDAQGYFTLTPCPTGVFFVHIDGRTSPMSAYPNGCFYPVVGKQWEAVPGKADNLAAGTGIIYLPRVCAGTLQPTSLTEDTNVAFPQQVLTLNPNLVGTTVEIPANSVFSDDGTRGGRIGIAPVPSDRLPSPLPPGLSLPLVITLQSDGAGNLDRPAPVSFPNLPDPVTGIKLGPGKKSALWSFNHDTGQWEVVGPMTVTADGNFLKSDPGVGIRQPGWHGAMPGSQVSGDPFPEIPDFDNPCWQNRPDADKLLEETKKCIVSLSNKLRRLWVCVDGISGFAFQAYRINDLIEKFGDRITNARLAADANDYESARQWYCLAVESYNEINKFVESALKAVQCAQTLVSSAKPLLTCAKSSLVSLEGYCGSLTNVPAECKTQRILCIVVATLKTSLDFIENGFKLAELKIGQFGFEDYRTIVNHAYQWLKAPNFAGMACSSAILLPPPDDLDFEPSIQTCCGGSEPSTEPEAVIRSEPVDFPPLPDADAMRLMAVTWSTTVSNIASQTSSTLTTLNAVGNETRAAQLEMARAYSNYASTRQQLSQRSPSPFYFRAWVAEDNGSVPFQIRGRSTDGRIFASLPSYYGFEIGIVDPQRLTVHSGFLLSPADGEQVFVPVLSESSDPSGDSDTDGLSGIAESILGTDPNGPDTDNDGVTDGAELKNGTDPLSGIAAATGIVGGAEVSSGDCRDVAAVNDVLAAACGSEGLQLLGVRQGLSPTKLSKVPTPSSATVVAMTGSLVAVGIGGGGTMIVDASTPDTPQVLRTIKLGSSVKSLAAVENTVYIGFEDGRLTAVDMLTGQLLANVNLGSAVHDLAVGSRVIYAATAGSLKTAPVTAAGSFGTVSSLAMSASVGAGGQRLRLFRGIDRLYAVHTEGFNVFDISAAAIPALIRNNTDGAFGWRHLVANGSGLALAATGPNSTEDGPHEVALYNLGADNAQANFLTNFTLPGSSYSTAFYNGLAYVADGPAGVQVVNIRPFDTLKVPPTITLNVTNSGGAITEGGFVTVSAQVTDDVQVRNVEFYVDGVKAETDGNFPFESRVIAPRIAPGKTTAVFRAKATDTGGNFAWSSDITLNLSLETIPPSVLSMIPPNGQFMAQCSGFTLRFSEPVKSSTLTPSTVRFYAAGVDGLIGTNDDIAVSTALLPASNSGGTYRDTASWQTAAPLEPGTYRVLATLGIQDTAGNALAAPFSGVFVVYSGSGGDDVDGDGIADSVEIALGYDPNNQDSNANGKADGDEDFDGDGLANSFELRFGLQPNNPDSDGNGINDALEDTDKDTLTTAQELAAGSDPTKSDSDGDSWPDQVEVQFASNPGDARSKPLSLVVGSPSVLTAIVGGGSTVAAPPTTITIIGGGTSIATPPTKIRIGNPPP